MTHTSSVYRVSFPPTTILQQIDDFPAQTIRSCEGSLHIRPRSTRTITPSEAEHLRSRGVVFRILRKIVPKPVTVKLKTEHASKNDVPKGITSKSTKADAGKNSPSGWSKTTKA